MATQAATHETKTKPSRASRQAARAAAKPVDAIRLLKEDHREVKGWFKDYEKLEEEGEKQALAEKICLALTVHTKIEEEIFYPAARAAIEDDDLIDEAQVEHATAKQLIARLEGMQPDDEKYSAIFTVLGEYVNHHIKEEETEMFPKVGRAKGDWQGLCDEMNARREELTEQLMPHGAQSDDESMPASSRRGPQRAGESHARAASERRTREAGDERGADDDEE